MQTIVGIRGIMRGAESRVVATQGSAYMVLFVGYRNEAALGLKLDCKFGVDCCRSDRTMGRMDMRVHKMRAGIEMDQASGFGMTFR